MTAVPIGISEGIGVVGIPVNEGATANCAGVGSGGGVGIAIAGVGTEVGTGADTGATVGTAVGTVVGTGADTGAVGNTVGVAKGRVPKDATPVGVGANGVVDSALPLFSFPNNRINTVLSSDSPNVSLDFCNLGIVFCT